MMIEIIQPGLFTTIQDKGRTGYRHLGIPRSGWMDDYSAFLANRLVGNSPNAALLEATLTGPVLKFNSSLNVAVTGAYASLQLNDQEVPCYKTLKISAGDVLNVGNFHKGCRAYIAVEGGLEGHEFLQSKATYTPIASGGYKGRALKAGDEVNIAASETPHQPVSIPEHLIPKFTTPWKIRIMEGPEFDSINHSSLEKDVFSVHHNSNRMGIRLNGFKGEAAKKEIISSPVNTGTIQLLPDNTLIVLMNDGQVTGGYPRIGNIITADLHLMAQVKPGDKLNFIKVSLQEAVRQYQYQQDLLKTL